MDQGEPSEKPFRLIPSPAGKVQLALLGRAQEPRPHPMSTQDYVMEAVKKEEEDPTRNDPDFNKNPWLRASELGYLTNGYLTPLRALKDWDTNERVPMVVALIKSCTRNQLAQWYLELKDPTGIYRAGMTDKAYEDYAGQIKVGACLVLTRIMIWKRSKKSRGILNITDRNIDEVLEKENEEEITSLRD